MDKHINDPLHGKTLQAIVEALEKKFGWAGLARKLKLNCFKNEPSIKSSLTFLRKTPWARQKVEEYYILTMSEEQKPDTGDLPDLFT